MSTIHPFLVSRIPRLTCDDSSDSPVSISKNLSREWKIGRPSRASDLLGLTGSPCDR